MPGTGGPTAILQPRSADAVPQWLWHICSGTGKGGYCLSSKPHQTARKHRNKLPWAQGC